MADLQMTKRPLLRTVGAIAALGGAVVALQYALRDLHWAEFSTQVATLDWRWLGLAVFFDIASYVAQGFRWRQLLKGSSIWQTTRAIYAGLFINEMVPMRPGEAIRAWIAARDLRTDIWTVVPTMVTERLMDGALLAVALVLVTAVAPIPQELAVATKIFLPVMAIAGAVVCWFGKRTFKTVDRITVGLQNPLALAASAAFLIGQALAIWSVMRASHLPLTWMAGFVVMLAVRVGTLIPSAPANVGTHQLSTTIALSFYGVPHATAAGFSLVVFAVLTFPLCFIGLLALLNTGLTWHQLRVRFNDELSTTPAVADGSRA